MFHLLWKAKNEQIFFFVEKFRLLKQIHVKEPEGKKDWKGLPRVHSFSIYVTAAPCVGFLKGNKVLRYISPVMREKKRAAGSTKRCTLKPTAGPLMAWKSALIWISLFPSISISIFSKHAASESHPRVFYLFFHTLFYSLSHIIFYTNLHRSRIVCISPGDVVHHPPLFPQAEF